MKTNTPHHIWNRVFVNRENGLFLWMNPIQEIDRAALALSGRGGFSLLRNDGQQNVRCATGGMVDLVLGRQPFRLVVVVPAGVQIAVESRKIAARDLDANAVART